MKTVDFSRLGNMLHLEIQNGNEASDNISQWGTGDPQFILKHSSRIYDKEKRDQAKVIIFE